MNAAAFHYQPGRYEMRPPANALAPFVVYDTLLEKPSSTHDTVTSATARAQILNRFSTGARI